ncbi:unnamed protein product [Strongylus vulgaris]|uniref:Uncharacterized protein n=1 Tax=Strongylus vulgaris TaxID=40348 RepID=A0A3P7IV17_STRVU|nr:unnamed protein product [Strongylus vulgaris]
MARKYEQEHPNENVFTRRTFLRKSDWKSPKQTSTSGRAVTGSMSTIGSGAVPNYSTSTGSSVLPTTGTDAACTTGHGSDSNVTTGCGTASTSKIGDGVVSRTSSVSLPPRRESDSGKISVHSAVYAIEHPSSPRPSTATTTSVAKEGKNNNDTETRQVHNLTRNNSSY